MRTAVNRAKRRQTPLTACDMAAWLCFACKLFSQPGYAGLDLLYPEILELDSQYRQALDDIRNDELASAECIRLLSGSLDT